MAVLVNATVVPDNVVLVTRVLAELTVNVIFTSVVLVTGELVVWSSYCGT